MATDIGKNLKGFWLKGMEAIGNTASNIASNTKYKVSEMNYVNRRREIMSDFGAISYELWQKGERFPERLETMLKELSDIDAKLNELRTEHLAGVNTQVQQDADEENPLPAEIGATMEELEAELAETDETADVPVMEVPEEEKEADEDDQASSLFDEIPVIHVEEAEQFISENTEEALNKLKETMDDLGKAAEDKYAVVEDRVDQAIGDLGDSLQKVSTEIGKGIEEIAEKLSGKDE